jgi:phosphatidate cytidylyltransferase
VRGLGNLPAQRRALHRGDQVMLPIFEVTLSGFVLGAILMALASRRAPPGTMQQRWLKLGVFFVIVHAVLGVAALGRPWTTLLLAAITAAGSVELWHAWRRMNVPKPVLVWPVYLLVCTLVLAISTRLTGEAFAFLFIVTAACDGFSQVVGQLIGRRRLAPRISPAKTIEGLLGGLVAALVVAAALRVSLLALPLSRILALAFATGLAGLAGDLAASWVKRRATIKDYSTALPGQGGILDRFDSLLGALAIVGAILAAAL